MKNVIAGIIIFILGMIISFEITMRTMKVYPENDGVVLIEIYGQEWVYEEDAVVTDR